MKASNSNDKAAASKSAQDTNRMQGEKSKSMNSENDSAKGGKDMKAEGRDSKSGTNDQATESRDKAGTTNAQTKSSRTPTGRRHDGQRRDLGDRGAAGRKAHPDQLRHQVGEDPGNHQRELQHLGRRGRARLGAASTRFRPGSSRSIRNGAAMTFDPGARPLRHRSSADPRDRLHHRRLTAFGRAACCPEVQSGVGRDAHPFSLAGSAFQKLVNE